MRPIEVWRATARAAALDGHSRWRQLAEIACLRLSEGKLQPDEYFNYRLYRRDLALAQKRAYIGYWMWDALYSPNCPRQAAIADSKLASYALFAREGVPHAPVRAVIGGGSDYPGCRPLSSAAEIAAFLATTTFPLFIKPDAGSHGLGAMLVDEAEPGALRLRDGSRVTFDKLEGATVPLLVQDVIAPHAELRRMTGGTPATARLFVIRRGAETDVHCAVLRIPVGRAMVDNFHAGRTGNLIAEIDVDRGICGTAVAGLGFDHRLADRHPDTGEAIWGAQVPDWTEACDMVRQAAQLFPGLPVQAWDVAFTPAGPSIIEVNAKGEFRILQHALQRGLIDDRLRQAARLKPSLIARKSWRASLAMLAYPYLQPLSVEAALIV